jgi:hypothetical protein
MSRQVATVPLQQRLITTLVRSRSLARSNSANHLLSRVRADLRLKYTRKFKYSRLVSLVNST